MGSPGTPPGHPCKSDTPGPRRVKPLPRQNYYVRTLKPVQATENQVETQVHNLEISFNY